MTLYGYRACLVHFGLVRFFAAIPTEYEGTQRRGEWGWRRGVRASLREPLGLAMLSAGSPLGAEMRKPHCGRPQTCAKESNVEAALRPLWTLFF